MIESISKLKIIKWFGFILCFIEISVKQNNKELFKSESFSEFQAGKASMFAMMLFFSPAFAFVGKNAFIWVAVTIMLFSIALSHVVVNASKYNKIYLNVGNYVNLNQTKSFLIVTFGFIILIGYAVFWLLHSAKWQ